ncbi:DUF5343 domain-containing protein [Duganella levis]|uniref:DUF5343 domain-containing protein n=1 Tax=Duganella levis TaxID=2692169 RepID=A0ABW9VWI3_9BURK|nr:DUF5343 domain-containing protein [Duganella levis]MYN25934.1 hypothetical protein [Duganella levis]
MATTIPYLTSPGSIKTALEKIRSAATPERVTKDFVTTVLQIKGGTGATIPPYLKRIGMVGSDGAPTDLYKQFRNPARSGVAIADAIKTGYRELLQANEYFFKLSDKDLKSLIVQVTGLGSDDRVVALIHSTLVHLRGFANFESNFEHVEINQAIEQNNDFPRQIAISPTPSSGRVGLNLSYTINLNLPATSDQAVFNAIFRSLKEHLLSSDE